MTDLTKCIEWENTFDSIYLNVDFMVWSFYRPTIKELNVCIQNTGVTGIDWMRGGTRSSREETHSRYKLGQNK